VRSEERLFVAPRRIEPGARAVPPLVAWTTHTARVATVVPSHRVGGRGADDSRSSTPAGAVRAIEA